MTLEEAIKHAEEVAEEKESESQNLEYSKLDWRHEANQCTKCAKEHRQLAEWLRELKQLREQQYSEDCINRKELYNALYEHFHDEDAPNNITEVRLGAVRNFVKDFPSATPTRNKGKWEYDAYKDRNSGHCNQCGHFMRYGAKTNFCPDCGAEMESEEC